MCDLGAARTCEGGGPYIGRAAPLDKSGHWAGDYIVKLHGYTWEATGCGWTKPVGEPGCGHGCRESLMVMEAMAWG